MSVSFPPQAMASLGPHRVKVDGKSLSSSSVTFNTWLSAAIDPHAHRRLNTVRSKVLTVERRQMLPPRLSLSLFHILLLHNRSLLFSPFPTSFSPSSPCSEAGQTSPRGALGGRATFLRQPVVLQGPGHLHQQEGRVPSQVCVGLC